MLQKTLLFALLLCAFTARGQQVSKTRLLHQLNKIDYNSVLSKGCACSPRLPVCSKAKTKQPLFSGMFKEVANSVLMFEEVSPLQVFFKSKYLPNISCWC